MHFGNKLTLLHVLSVFAKSYHIASLVWLFHTHTTIKLLYGLCVFNLHSDVLIFFLFFFFFIVVFTFLFHFSCVLCSTVFVLRVRRHNK